MLPPLNSAIGRLRIASLLDGITYLILLFIAMPLKYFGDLPIAVTIAGSIHGFFFILLGTALFLSWLGGKLPFIWCVFTVICAILPFAPFFLDRKLRTFA